MLSDGQKIFAVFFILAFLVITAVLFYKDSKQNPTLFKGTYWVLIAIVATIIGYIFLQKILI